MPQSLSPRSAPAVVAEAPPTFQVDAEPSARAMLAGSVEWAHRLNTAGVGGLSEAETLALVLARCRVAGLDPAAAAETLLTRFGCIGRVVGASGADLARVIGAEAADTLVLLHALLVRSLEHPLRGRSVLSSWSAVKTYLQARLAGRTREAFHVLFLDKLNRLIADERMGEGTVDHAPVYPREVVRRALELSASALCLAHNHPSGGMDPSQADIEMTKAVVAAGRPLSIAVHDHWLVAGDQVVSFKALGLM